MARPAKKTEKKNEPVEKMVSGDGMAKNKPEAAEKVNKKEPIAKTTKYVAKPKEMVPPDAPSPKQVENPEPTPAIKEAPVRRGGFVSLVLGGSVAALIGFGASQYTGNNSWPFDRGPTKADLLETRLDEQNTNIIALEAKISDLEKIVSAPKEDPQIAVLGKGQIKTQNDVDDLSERVDVMIRDLTDLKNRPIPDIGATQQAVAAYEKELTGMREMFQSELERIEAEQKSARKIEKTSEIRATNALEKAALANLQVAVDGGEPLGPTLDQMNDTGISIPELFVKHAESGIPTLGSLQSSFPDSARLAIDASLTAAVDAGEVGKFSAFLRRQVGTRSLSPKEGSDTDAVLSRAEAALGEGDLATALGELDALNTAATKMMADWISDAKIRQEAMTTVTDLSESLNNLENQKCFGQL